MERKGECTLLQLTCVIDAAQSLSDQNYAAQDLKAKELSHVKKF